MCIDGGNDAYCRYIVFWYPTIFHENLGCNNDNDLKHKGFRVKEKNNYSTEPCDISDESPENKLFLEKKASRNGDLTFTLKKGTSNESLELEFEFKNSNNTGFVVYSYKNDLEQRLTAYLGINPTDDTKVRQTIESIFNLCYHFAKDIYHKHEAHKDSDYRLMPYYIDRDSYLDKEPNIFQENNKVVKHFIHLYEDLFVTHYAKTISESYETFSSNYSKFLDLIEKGENGDENIIKHWGELQEYSEKIEKGLKKLKGKEIKNIKCSYLAAKEHAKNNIRAEEAVFRDEIVNETTKVPYSKQNYQDLVTRVKKTISNYSYELTDFCNNALTEYNYCKTLLESVYNTEFNHNPLHLDNNDIPKDSNDTEKNRCTEVAFNIRNSLRYIEGIRKKCSMWDNLITHNLTQDVEKLIQENNKLTDSAKKQIEKSKRTDNISLFLGGLSVILGLFSLILSVRSCESNHAKKCVCERCEIHQTASTKLCDSATFENDTVRCKENNIAVESIERKSDFPKEECSSKMVPSNNSRK